MAKGEKLYGFPAELAAPLTQIARERLAKSHTNSTSEYDDINGPNIRAYVVEPFEEITAATVDSANCIVAGFGDCWIIERDKDDDSMDYRTDDAGRRVEVTVYNLLDEAIGDSLGSGSGSGCSPGPLYFATQDMFGDLWIGDQFDGIQSPSEMKWQGYLFSDQVISSTTPATVSLLQHFNTAPDVFSLNAGVLTINRTGLLSLSFKANLDRQTPPAFPFAQHASIWFDIAGVDVPKSEASMKWQTLSIGVGDPQMLNADVDASVVSGQVLQLEAAWGEASMDNFVIRGGAASNRFGTVVTVHF